MNDVRYEIAKVKWDAFIANEVSCPSCPVYWALRALQLAYAPFDGGELRYKA